MTRVKSGSVKSSRCIGAARRSGFAGDVSSSTSAIPMRCVAVGHVTVDKAVGERTSRVLTLGHRAADAGDRGRRALAPHLEEGGLGVAAFGGWGQRELRVVQQTLLGVPGKGPPH